MKKNRILSGLIFIALVASMFIMPSNTTAALAAPATHESIQTCGLNGNGHASASQSSDGQSNNHFFVTVTLPDQPAKPSGNNAQGYASAWREYMKTVKILVDNACEKAITDALALSAAIPNTGVTIINGNLVVSTLPTNSNGKTITNGQFILPAGTNSSSSGDSSSSGETSSGINNNGTNGSGGTSNGNGNSGNPPGQQLSPVCGPDATGAIVTQYVKSVQLANFLKKNKDFSDGACP